MGYGRKNKKIFLLANSRFWLWEIRLRAGRNLALASRNHVIIFSDFVKKSSGSYSFAGRCSRPGPRSDSDPESAA
jgi:hypothetical protein